MSLSISVGPWRKTFALSAQLFLAGHSVVCSPAALTALVTYRLVRSPVSSVFHLSVTVSGSPGTVLAGRWEFVPAGTRLEKERERASAGGGRREATLATAGEPTCHASSGGGWQSTRHPRAHPRVVPLCSLFRVCRRSGASTSGRTSRRPTCRSSVVQSRAPPWRRGRRGPASFCPRSKAPSRSTRETGRERSSSSHSRSSHRRRAC